MYTQSLHNYEDKNEKCSTYMELFLFSKHNAVNKLLFAWEKISIGS